MLNALEGIGLRCDGRTLALNSYENRVYQIGIDEGKPVVTKFYRPGRWTDEAILEEHEFSVELVDKEIPVVAPTLIDGNTLHHAGEYRFAVYPRCGGRWPDLEDEENRKWMGRFIARIHMVGASSEFEHRRVIDPDQMGRGSAGFLIKNKWLPEHLAAGYEAIITLLLDRIDARFAEIGELNLIRLHGDCHPGNILWTDDGPHFVDLDDCVTGPAVQDLWMLLSGDREEMQIQLADVLEGYAQFANFDVRELLLIEPLRTLRMIHYAAWLARRWVDPAFPHSFPWFNETRYWEEHLLSLKEQAAALDEPPLEI